MLARLQLSLVSLALGLCCALGGCSLLQGGADSDQASLLQTTGVADQFQAVAKAKQNNAVVLHVIGAKEPSRIIPLPNDGTTVYVSMLLNQSGVTKDFGLIDATLHRNGTDIMSGVKMAVRFIPKSKTVVPECDYALQPGDRLEIQEKKISPLEAMSSMFSQGGNRRPVFVQ